MCFTRNNNKGDKMDNNNNMTKPTFSDNSDAVSGINEELQAARNSRSELGALWRKTSKTGAEYFTMKLELTPEQAQQLVNNVQTKTYLSKGEQISKEVCVANLVVFENKSNGNDPRKPSHRIYLEIR
jgi:hypothetical protein